MEVVSGARESLPTGLYPQIARYRHQVFVERLGWDLRAVNGEEQDQFDRPDTAYVVARDAQRRVIGCARLLPTTRPYLLGELFPELLNGRSPPCSPQIWELSRFAAVDLANGPASSTGQFSSPIAVSLLRHSIDCAASFGAASLITVSPVGIERLLRRAGFKAHRAGPPMVWNGHPVVACVIEVD